jgi:hypothetical protein
MIKLLYALIILSIVLLSSCGKTEQQIKEEKEAIIWQKKKQLKIYNEQSIIELSKNYNSVLGWDTVETYTYVLQEMFIDNEKPISFKGMLIDIIKTDSSYSLVLYKAGGHYHKNTIAKISSSPEKFIELRKILESYNHSNIGCFIIKVSKIISAYPQIKSEFEYDIEMSYSYLDYDFDEPLLIFNGELIDFYLNETIEKNEK